MAHHIAELVNIAPNPQQPYVGDSVFAHEVAAVRILLHLLQDTRMWYHRHINIRISTYSFLEYLKNMFSSILD